MQTLIHPCVPALATIYRTLGPPEVSDWSWVEPDQESNEGPDEEPNEEPDEESNGEQDQ
jgi:hypothetical protein